MPDKKRLIVKAILTGAMVLAGIFLITNPMWNKPASNGWSEGKYWASPEGLGIIANFIIGGVLLLSGILTYTLSSWTLTSSTKHQA